MFIQARSQETLCNVAIPLPASSQWEVPASYAFNEISAASIQPQTLDVAWAIVKDALKK